MPYLISKGIENLFRYAGKWKLSAMRVSLSKQKFNFKKGNNKVSLGNEKTITSFFFIRLIGYFLNEIFYRILNFCETQLK